MRLHRSAQTATNSTVRQIKLSALWGFYAVMKLQSNFMLNILSTCTFLICIQHTQCVGPKWQSAESAQCLNTVPMFGAVVPRIQQRNVNSSTDHGAQNWQLILMTICKYHPKWQWEVDKMMILMNVVRNETAQTTQDTGRSGNYLLHPFLFLSLLLIAVFIFLLCTPPRWAVLSLVFSEQYAHFTEKYTYGACNYTAYCRRHA